MGGKLGVPRIRVEAEVVLGEYVGTGHEHLLTELELHLRLLVGKGVQAIFGKVWCRHHWLKSGSLNLNIMFLP